MKTTLWLAVVAVIAPSFLARAENVTVLKNPQSSIQKPTITVVHDNEPVASATVSLYRFRNGGYREPLENLHLKLVTNSQGQIILPTLPWGIYKLAASSGHNLKGEILLSMAPPSYDPSWASFELNLIHTWGNSPALKEDNAFSIKLDYYPTKEQILAKEDQLPATKIAAFQGRVSDITGAYIPSTSIAVTRMDVPGKKSTMQFISDAHGKFAASLPTGDYIATFTCSGFKTLVLHLVIVEGANSQPLKIKLNVGSST